MSDYEDSEIDFDSDAEENEKSDPDQESVDDDEQHSQVVSKKSTVSRQKRKLKSTSDQDEDTDSQEDNRAQSKRSVVKKIKKEATRSVDDDVDLGVGGIVYASIITPETTVPQVSLSISGSKTKLNPKSKYFPQTVRFHEIKSGGGGSREVFVDTLVEQNERGIISRGIVTLDSLVYVVPFFDLT